MFIDFKTISHSFKIVLITFQVLKCALKHILNVIYTLNYN